MRHRRDLEDNIFPGVELLSRALLPVASRAPVETHDPEGAWASDGPPAAPGWEADASKSTTQKPPLPLLLAAEIEPALNSGTFVAGLLGAGSLGCVYGPSNCGKTFFTIDLALRIASGMEWRGRAVDQGVVVYVAGEGGHGARNRVTAWLRRHDVDPQRVAFAMIPSPVNLLDPAADLARLVTAVHSATERLGMPLRMVVIDTLSRAMAGGDENSPEAMTAFIGNCDSLRDQVGAHVLLIHHTGKDTGRGARGHSSLRAALDTEIELSAPEGASGMVATVVKQRDLAKGQTFPFSLEVAVLGQDERGDDVTSCTVVHDEDGSRQTGKRRPTGQAAIALNMLREALDATGREAPHDHMIPRGVKVTRLDDWRSYVEASAITESGDPESKRKAFKRAAQKLQEQAFIGTRNDLVWIAE